jgi:hypothetical protein
MVDDKDKEVKKPVEVKKETQEPRELLEGDLERVAGGILSNPPHTK